MGEMQIFDYKGKEVRAVEKDGVTWWVLKDVCSVLELTDTNKMSERLDTDELTRIKLVSGNQHREMICGKDITTVLGYKYTVNALKTHCKEDGVLFRHLIDSLGRN